MLITWQETYTLPIACILKAEQCKIGDCVSVHGMDTGDLINADRLDEYERTIQDTARHDKTKNTKIKVLILPFPLAV